MDVRECTDEFDFRGTGFLVTPRFALTAWHVVKDAEAPNDLAACRLKIPNRSVLADVVAELSDSHIDVAVLRLREEIQNIEFLKPCNLLDAEPRSRWQTYGFPALPHDAGGRYCSGEVVGPDPVLPRVQLFGQELTGALPVASGWSGGPCMVGSHVAGVMTRALTASQNDRTAAAATLYAVPWEELAKALERRISGLKTRSKDVEMLLDVLRHRSVGCVSVSLGTARAEPRTEAIVETLKAVGDAHFGADIVPAARDGLPSVRFCTPLLDRQELTYPVIEARDLAFLEDAGSKWLVRPWPQLQEFLLRYGRTPVLLLWRPPGATELLWKLVRSTASPQALTISKAAVVTPALAVDLALEARLPSTSPRPVMSLKAPFHLSARESAKRYYRRVLQGTTIRHPALGDVRFSWHGWRHLTGKGRTVARIQRSLEVIQAARAVTESPGRYVERRNLTLQRRSRGSRTIEQRLAIYESSVAIDGNQELVRSVFRITIDYPRAWQSLALREVRIDTVFESLYRQDKSAATSGFEATCDT